MKGIDQVESQRTCEDINYNISQPGEKMQKPKPTWVSLRMSMLTDHVLEQDFRV